MRNPFARPPWLDEGEEPDYRFTLANERTFLAWMRTTLGFLAGAIAVVQLVPRFRIPGARTALGLVLCATALFIAVYAYRRWRSVEQAMRNSRPLPYSIGLLVLTASLTLVAGFALILLVVERA